MSVVTYNLSATPCYNRLEVCHARSKPLQTRVRIYDHVCYQIFHQIWVKIHAPWIRGFSVITKSPFYVSFFCQIGDFCWCLCFQVLGTQKRNASHWPNKEVFTRLAARGLLVVKPGELLPCDSLKFFFCLVSIYQQNLDKNSLFIGTLLTK